MNSSHSPSRDASASGVPDPLGPTLQRAAHVSRWLAWLGGALLLLCAILVSLDVVFGALLKVTYFESCELSTYAFAIATSFQIRIWVASGAAMPTAAIFCMKDRRDSVPSFTSATRPRISCSFIG